MYKKFLVALAFGSLTSTVALGQTVIPGGEVSGAWETAGSPYLVEGEITVPAGEILTIEAGVSVVFQGHYKFIVNGYLEALGTESDSILFTADDPTRGWHGIRFINAPDSSHLFYCIMENGIAMGGLPNSCGGGIYCQSSNPVISHCTIRDNSAIYGGGISCYSSNPSILYSTIADNSATESFSPRGGGLHCQDSNPLISKCLFTGNVTLWQGGAILCQNSNPTIINCTISMNSAGTSATGGGGGIFLSSSNVEIVNTIISDNSGHGGILFSSSPDASISYSDFYSNQYGAFYGDPPSGLGQIITVNANGDSCDAYYNIFEDPDFVNPAMRDFHLQADSPCIDAGDPTTPFDPDGTIADMGAFYFDQGTPPVVITLTPVNPPIIIPATGGTFEYELTLDNVSGLTQVADVWIDATLPNGSIVGPLGMRDDVIMEPGFSLYRLLSQYVPLHAPEGQYTVNGYVGDYNLLEVWSEDHFTFMKVCDGDEVINDLPMVEGLDTDEIASSSKVLTENFSINAYPNPFNPTTVLSYQLSALSFVNLSVYDISGRKVKELVNGWQETGLNEVTFDGSGLPSGMYIYRLQAGDFTASGKMILMK